MLIKLLAFSFGTITILLSSKLCGSLLILWSFYYFLFTLFLIILDFLMNSYTDTSSNLLQVLCSSHIFFIVDLYVSCLLYQPTLVLKPVLGCDWKSSEGRTQTGHIYLLTLWACGRLWRSCWVFIAYAAINILIGFKNIPQGIQVWSCIRSYWPKGTKGPWINTSQLFNQWSKAFKKNFFFCCLCFDNCFGCTLNIPPKGQKGPLVLSLDLFFFLNNTGDIFMFVRYFFVVYQRGTKAHLVNPFPIFKHNYVNVFFNCLCVKTVVAIIFIQGNNKAHFRQKSSLILLHCSQCLPEINNFYIMVCSLKKHMNVTTNLQSLIYLCLVLSSCVKHKTCGSNMINS